MIKSSILPERGFLLLLLLQGFHVAVSFASERYCNEKVPVYGVKSVIKTRTQLQKPKGLLKMFKDDKVITEEYATDEKYVARWDTVVKCCEGYQLTGWETCEPVCTKGCPEHANCVDSNQCQCAEGYVSVISEQDGSDYCESICGKDCEEQCQPGYIFDQKDSVCKPKCTLGNGCLHGHCTAPEECTCLPAYYMDEATNTCLSRCTFGYVWDKSESRCVSSDGDYMNLGKVGEKWNEEGGSPAKGELDISLDTDGLNTDSTFELTSTTVPDLSSETSCPNGYVYYRGDCRPEIFPNDEFDCNNRACVPNASCLENGTCVCNEGLVWKHNPARCDIPEEFTKATQINYLWMIILIALGATAIMSLILFGILKFFPRQRGHLNVEAAKTDLYCQYNKENSVEGKIAVL